MIIRTRIAPSPTGYLHIGTARTALFNFLFARKNGGTFILRIEDTDLERSDKKFEEEIFDSLAWLDIIADENPNRGGPFAPYRQTERLDRYEEHLKRLLANGSAFYCFHTELELSLERDSLLAAGKNPTHWCAYRDVQAPPSADRPAIIRFKTPAGRAIAFTDLIRGEILFQSDTLGDFSLAKNLRTPLYNFAVAIDDYEMRISHVIRGEDHISNTPKQLLILESLGLPTPSYAHLPLILGSDRAKLSKRHGATSIREYREQGYLPEALVNFMSLLGWNPGDEREIFSLEELANLFDLGHVQKSGAIFNMEKLDWLNGEYIRRMRPQELATRLVPYIESIGEGDAKTPEQSYIERVALVEQPRLKKLSDIKKVGYFFRKPAYDIELLRWKRMENASIVEALERTRAVMQDIPEAAFDAPTLETKFLEAIGGGDKGALLWPLRVALTGEKASPGPFDMMHILGKRESADRIAEGIAKIRGTGNGNQL